MLVPLALIAEEVCTLEACSLRAPHPRQRRRAQALLGQSLKKLATFYAVRYATIHAWVTAWTRHGLAGLAECSRSGRPSKLPPLSQKK